MENEFEIGPPTVITIGQHAIRFISLRVSFDQYAHTLLRQSLRACSLRHGLKAYVVAKKTEAMIRTFESILC